MFYYMSKLCFTISATLCPRALTLLTRAHNRMQNRLTYADQLRMHINTGSVVHANILVAQRVGTVTCCLSLNFNRRQ